jgi:membrane-associated phospholipid phosphatase
MAGWQNGSLACDVDGNQSVTPIDVLILINTLNREGDLVLTGSAAEQGKPFYDVNGDTQLTSLDILRVINAINRAMPNLALSTQVAEGLDADLNGVVDSEMFHINGTTGPNATIDIQIVGRDGNVSLTKVSSNSSGTFQASFPIGIGLNRVSIHVLDEIGSKVDYNANVRRGSIVTEWNATLLDRVRELSKATANAWTPAQAVQTKPPGIARNLAMIYGAMFDAINTIDGGYESFLVSVPRQSNANANAAATAAAHRVASLLYSDSESVQAWDRTYNETLKSIPDNASRALGIQIGESVADAIVQARSNDGSATTRTINFSNQAGKWHPSAPSFEAVLPQWPLMQPLRVPSIVSFRPNPPPELTSNAYAQAVDEVMRLGGKTSTQRTAAQTASAFFWADGSGTASPPGHWNQIAVDCIASKNLSLVEQVRTMAILNFALADAGIASWDAKYDYELWRPIDAIQNADVDGNVSTIVDKAWEPLIKTPPFPSYVSGHSAFSGAACAILTSLFGSSQSFVSQRDVASQWEPSKSLGMSSTDRVYGSFLEAAREAGLSRIYGGIHFNFDNTEGISMGISIGDYVATHSLKKL